jgi:hypothetical protein
MDFEDHPLGDYPHHSSFVALSLFSRLSLSQTVLPVRAETTLLSAATPCWTPIDACVQQPPGASELLQAAVQ